MGVGSILSNVQITVHLETEPELQGHIERLSKPQGGISGNEASAMDDLVDTARRNMNTPGQAAMVDFFRHVRSEFK